MKKCILILTFFLLLYTPYIAHGESLNHIIEDAEEISIGNGYSVGDVAKEILKGNITIRFSDVFQKIGNLLFQNLKEQSSFIVRIILIGIMSSIAVNLLNGKNGIGSLACISVLSLLSLKSFTFAISTAEETIDTILLFVKSFMPAVVTATAAAGQAGQMTASASVFASMQIFISVCQKVMLPLCAAEIIFAIADSLSENHYLKGLVHLLKQAISWGTGLFLTLYGAVIGIQTAMAGTFDTMAGKTAKYVVGTFVPVVGGALSESLELVLRSAAAIKSALGIGGVIGIFFVILKPLIEVFSVALSFKLASGILTVTGESSVCHLISEVGSGLVRISAIILIVAVMFIISVAMLLSMRGGFI